MGMLYFSERGRRKLDRLGIVPLVDEEDGVECPAEGKAIVAFSVDCNLYDEWGRKRLSTTVGLGYMAVWDGEELGTYSARVQRYYSDRWLLTARLRRWWILRQAIRSLRQF